MYNKLLQAIAHAYSMQAPIIRCTLKIVISHLNYVQLYETLHLEMAAHFQKVTETGLSLNRSSYEAGPPTIQQLLSSLSEERINRLNIKLWVDV